MKAKSLGVDSSGHAPKATLELRPAFANNEQLQRGSQLSRDEGRVTLITAPLPCKALHHV